MKTIIWDVDDVLNDLMKAWLEDWLSKGQTLFFAYDQLSRNPPHELLDISASEYLASLDEFRLSGKVNRLQPVKEIWDWFCLHGDKFHHVALTATPLRSAHISAEWVMRNFGKWIRSFNVVPSPRPGEDSGCGHKTKSEFLRWWGKGDILIDDNEDNVAGAVAQGMHAVLFPRPWNRSSLTVKEALGKLAHMADGEKDFRQD